MHPYEKRIARVRAGMAGQGIDCFVVTPSSTMTYLTGFSLEEAEERLLAFVLPGAGEPFWVANRLYRQELSQVPVGEPLYWSDGEDPFAFLTARLEQSGKGPSVIMVDAVIPGRFLLPLLGRLPNARPVLEAGLVDDLRLCKDTLELEQMAEACRRADTALERAIRADSWVGKTEREFFARLSMEMTGLGIKRPGACVCAGANAAMPHHRPDNTVIQQGQCLLVDFGGTYNSYYTDMTRMFFFGRPGTRFREVHDIVLEALYSGHEAARCGRPIGEVDAAARDVITRHGYGEFFTHRTGHGIGIDVHEEPYVTAGSGVIMRPGMAFSIEPGIYLPGEFGVRIEDQAVITQDGVRILHSFPRELQILA